MGNSLGGSSKKTAKIMKINGEIIKLKTPVLAGDVVKNWPAGYVLLESEAVKHFGIRAKPLELQQGLEPKRLYFLVELPQPKFDEPIRRVRSGMMIHMNAKDRLESLKLARRSTSDLSSLMKQQQTTTSSSSSSSGGGGDNDDDDDDVTNSVRRLKMRLPKAEVARLMEESKDEAEAAQKIMDLCLAAANNNNNIGQQQSIVETAATQAFKKRVSFMAVDEGGEIQLAKGGGPGIESY